MRELLQKRSFTAKHFEIEPGKLLLQAHIGHIHFRDGPLKNGAFRDCDTVPEYNAVAGVFEMTKASYEAQVGLHGEVRYFNVDHSLEFRLPNPNRVEAEQYDGSPFGLVGKALIWRDILQPGGHQIVEFRNNSLAKIFRFEQRPLSNVIEFQAVASDGLKFGDGESEFDLGKQASRSIRGRQGLFGTKDRLSFIRQPRAWNHRGESVDVELRFFRRDGTVWIQKIIPQDFVDKTFVQSGAWLEVDTTTSFYTGAGDGYYLRHNVSEVWATIRAGAQTLSLLTVTADWVCGISYDASDKWSMFTRGVLPVNTSGLGSSAAVTAVTLYLRGYAKENSLGSGALVIDRYTALGYAVANYVGERQASDTPYASFSNSNWNAISFNATGISNINKTGTSQLACRKAHDVDNVEPLRYAGSNYFGIYYSEGAYPPYLEITYSYPPVEITPSAASAISLSIAPSVIQAGMNVTPAAATGVAAISNPGIVVVTYVSPSPALAISGMSNPFVELGPIAFTPTAAFARGRKVNPAIVLAAVNVGPAAASAIGVTTGPTVRLGTISLVPSAASAIAAIVDPSLSSNTFRNVWANRGPGFIEDDLVISRRQDFTSTGIAITLYDIRGRVVSGGLNGLGKEYSDIIVLDGADYINDYKNDLEWVVVGNATDPSRSNVIIISSDDAYSPYIELRSGVTSFAEYGSMASLRARLGNLTGITDANFGALTGYGIFTDNAYFKGHIALGSATSLTVGAGLWADKLGNFRVGAPATNKTLTFTVDTGAFSFGSGVTLNWAAVDGRPTSLANLDASAANKLGGIENGATVGAVWGSNMTPPPRFADAPSAGLCVTGTYMGYYNGSTWLTYTDNSGHFYLGGLANGILQWNGSTLLLTSVSGGNTVTISPTSSTCIAVGPTGAPTFTVTQAGVVTISAVTGGYTVQISPGSSTVLAAGPTGAPTFTLTQAGNLSIGTTLTFTAMGTNFVEFKDGGSTVGCIVVYATTHNMSFFSSGQVHFQTGAGELFVVNASGAILPAATGIGCDVDYNYGLKVTGDVLTTGQLTLSGITTSTSAIAGSNGDVPAQVEGYISITIGSTQRKIPYYKVS